jgi:hypothetical protein
MEPMYSFVKSLKKAGETRRYTIQSTESGWEVREETGAGVIRRSYYQDWHRVERARLSMTLHMADLRAQGWREI